MATPRYLRPKSVSVRYDIAVFTLAHWRCTGGGPPFTKPSATIVLYEIEALEAWLKARTTTNTAQADRAREAGHVAA